MGSRILFVDDDSAIRATLPQILEMHGFQVRSAATVAEALRLATSHEFDVLISDLNISNAGDGFTVVSAMRSIQPHCRTFILTGYPALETALQAIRMQVDEYLIKPATIPELISAIERKVAESRPSAPGPIMRISAVLRHNVAEITSRTLAAMQVHPQLSSLPLSDDERSGATPALVKALVQQLESHEPDLVPSRALRAARRRGELRKVQGYDPSMLVEQIRVFEQVIFEVIQENLLSLDLSFLMLDLKRMNGSLGIQLRETLLAYLEEKPAAA